MKQSGVRPQGFFFLWPELDSPPGRTPRPTRRANFVPRVVDLHGFATPPNTPRPSFVLCQRDLLVLVFVAHYIFLSTLRWARCVACVLIDPRVARVFSRCMLSRSLSKASRGTRRHFCYLYDYIDILLTSCSTQLQGPDSHRAILPQTQRHCWP